MLPTNIFPGLCGPARDALAHAQWTQLLQAHENRGAASAVRVAIREQRVCEERP
jgi:hypothetical protein